MSTRARRLFWRLVIASLITLPYAVYDLSGLKAARERRNRS